MERFFYLDDADRNLIARRRSDHHRLGFGMQLGTVRAVGRFLEDPLEVPWAAVEFVAVQLGIADTSCVKKYVQRLQTPCETRVGDPGQVRLPGFEDQQCTGRFSRFS